VDLGTPVMVLDQKVREELEVDKKKILSFRVGDLEVQVDSSTVETDTELGFTGHDGKRTVPVEAALSGSVLKNYQVVFDYGKRTLTVAKPNTLKGNGNAVPCRVNDKTGLISLTAVIAEHTYAFAIDPGSAYSWIRDDIAQKWLKARPDWSRGIGAVGEANMQTRTDHRKPWRQFCGFRRLNWVRYNSDRLESLEFLLKCLYFLRRQEKIKFRETSLIGIPGRRRRL